MPSKTRAPAYDSEFRRLAKLQGSDPAFFILAVHSFMEGCLRASFSVYGEEDDNFPGFLSEFKDKLQAQGCALPDLGALDDIRKQHFITNQARHFFGSASVADARAATFLLERFCKLAKIPAGQGLSLLLDYLKAWDERRSYSELVGEVNELGYRFQIAKNDAAKAMAERVAALEAIQAEVAGLQAQAQAKDLAIAELQASKERKDARVDELRAERNALTTELRAAKQKAVAYDDAQAYLDELSRLTVLSRTRSDYEKSVIRFTPEQKKVLEQIKLDADFLVKGAAGTGKTLVLLKAIEKAKAGGSQPGLDYPELKGSIALITYTNTLAKYDQYIASLMAGGTRDGRVSTVDAFLLARLREIDPGRGIDYRNYPEELAKRFPAAGLSAKELAAEIEGFIWGNDVTEAEYLVEGIERRGMKRPLSKEQRAAVWSSAQAMEAAMEESRTYTKNKAALAIAKAASAGSCPRLGRADYIFVDEAQDLPAAVLKAIKACAARCVILAGDADQSIYQPGFSFKRAGIDISGRTRILRTNFRNTIQLHEVAERYRRMGGGIDDENQPEAFRDGPYPELYEAADANEMLDLLEKRLSVFLNVLGYAPENVCIVVPKEEDLQSLNARLSADGLSLADIRDRSFDFSEAGSVRLTTMHSAKGLDFPVVLLYLPSFHVIGGSHDADTSDRMARNLLYVAMTRAMDHVNVFIRADTENPALRDLAACFAAAEPDRAAEKE